MSIGVRVHLLPSHFEPSVVAGGTAVIVDILRASTTMTEALSNGAESVVPCQNVEEALAVRDSAGEAEVLLGGERGGIMIDGFDLGNSPDDYSAEVVSGKMIGFTTTNGTKAILRCEAANQIVIGCFTNLTAIASMLRHTLDPVHIVCAGTNGAITGEDVLFAGALALRLSLTEDLLDDSARIAASFWQQAVGRDSDVRALSSAVEACLRKSQGGRNLIELGYDKDIFTASQVDSVSSFAVKREGKIRLNEK